MRLLKTNLSKNTNLNHNSTIVLASGCTHFTYTKGRFIFIYSGHVCGLHLELCKVVKYIQGNYMEQNIVKHLNTYIM